MPEKRPKAMDGASCVYSPGVEMNAGFAGDDVIACDTGVSVKKPEPRPALCAASPDF